MRILISLMYYRPHYSGLTIYTERLAKALARRGHQVTVLTSRFDPKLPKFETQAGVRIIRPRVVMRISKGVIMPSMPVWAWKLAGEADAINTHAPQPDAAILAAIGRLRRKPVVLTYHCDLQLPKGLVHYAANQGSHLANHAAARLADAIATNTMDYAQHSALLQHYLEKVVQILPPIELANVGEADLQAFRQKYQIRPEQKIIGMAARLATEKGVEYLVQALPKIIARFPTARVLFAGQHEHVLGEEPYAQKLAPLIESLGAHWTFLGVLPEKEWASFFKAAQVTVLPSINSTESFGMVQVESMISGTPVVASDRPGVRYAVQNTGMGKIVAQADADALAQALIDVLEAPENYQADPCQIQERYHPDRLAKEYEDLFQSLRQAGK